MINIEVGFDGGCPQSMEGIGRTNDNEFTVYPSWRETPGTSEDGIGRTTRLGFRLRNDGDKPKRAIIHVDWQYHDAPADAYTYSTISTCEKYMSLRDFCVVNEPESERWDYLRGTVDESVATFALNLAPGLTEMHWHPPYSYGQCESFVRSLVDKSWTRVEKIGASAKGRNLWLIRISDDSSTTKRRFLVTTRMHAYESGSSYMVEGMIRFLLGEDPPARQARSDWEFLIVPMVNPDGVHDGMGKLTHPTGVDLQWALPETDDPIHKALRSLVDRVEPDYYCDLHNWQCKNEDGVLDMNAERWEQFQALMPPAVEFGKSWLWKSREMEVDLSGRERVHFRHYCTAKYKCPAVSFETSWFGRQPEDIRKFGYKALRSVLMVEEVGFEL